VGLKAPQLGGQGYGGTETCSLNVFPQTHNWESLIAIILLFIFCVTLTLYFLLGIILDMDYNQLKVGSHWRFIHPGNAHFYIEILSDPNLWELKEYNLKGYVPVKGTLVAVDGVFSVGPSFSLSLGPELSIEPISKVTYDFWQNMCTRP
jgi:hypothetical protein